MPETGIDYKVALQVARSFNLAFNNAIMYGGDHQTTKDSALSLYRVVQPLLDGIGMITISTEKNSVFVENHCVDRVVSAPRILNRFNRAHLQSVSLDREIRQESMVALFHVLGALVEFQDVETMKVHLDAEQVSGVRMNYVIYRKVTVDDAVVSKDILSDSHNLLGIHPSSRSGTSAEAEPGKLLRQLSELLTLHGSLPEGGSAGLGSTAAPDLSLVEYDSYIANQIKAINHQLDSAELSTAETGLSPAQMLEAIYNIRENVLENMRLQKETGKLAAAGELAINEINLVSYRVIVRLIRDEYRGDRTISVKRLAQIIRRMLPEINELRYLLPQLKDGLFAEGMTPADYLALVKELRSELHSDELIQVLAEASDEIGLSVNEIVEGVREAPEEAARLIVLAAEIKKGGVATDEHQMSGVLSDYIEKVSRALALQAPEVAAPDGGAMLKAVVTRIEREILDRLKAQNISRNTVSDVAQKLANQFAETVALLKGDWVKSHLGPEKPTEETLLAIIEQVAESGQVGVAGDIRSYLLDRGIAAETIDKAVARARQRAAAAITHAIDIPPGVFDPKTTLFFLGREIKMNLRYNTPFSAMLVSYEKVVDLRSYSIMPVTQDITIQLTNQALKWFRELHKRDVDIIGVFSSGGIPIPFLLFPMTGETGAHFVKKRIDKDLPCHEFVVDGITVHVEPIVTVSCFNRKTTPDRASFLKALYQSHCQPKFS